MIKTGLAGRKGGFILGPISRNIITTYLLPGFLSGVELDSHTNLSAKYREAFELKGSSSFGSTVAPRGYRQKASGEGKGPSPVDMPSGVEKAHKHREQCLLTSFGTHGIDAVALSMVCAMWLQDCRTIDCVFQHCCSLGLLSAASNAHMPLLPMHTYGLFEAFLSSASSFSPTPPTNSSATSFAAFCTPHPLSPIAGHVTVERVRSSISAAALVRWLLVSGTNKEEVDTRSSCEDGKQLLPLSAPSVEFKLYNNRNLNFNTQQIRNIMSSVKLLIMEGVKQSEDRSVIVMRIQDLKIKIMQSIARQKKCNPRAGDSSDNIMYENDFKKACRASFISWKSASARERAQQQQEVEKSRSASAHGPSVVPGGKVDIFDQPVRRAPRVAQDVSTVTSASSSSSSVPVPVPSPQAAFDIFDQPVRRAPRVAQDVSTASSSSVSVSVPVPVLGLAPYTPTEFTDLDIK